jgi:putative ABC transport system substrate-binding protein
VESQLDVLYPEAERAGVEIIEAPVAGSEELSVYLSNEIDKGGVKIDAVLFLAEPLAVEPGAFSVICGFARGRGIPLGGAYAETEDGCKSIFGVHVNDFESGKQAAPLAGKILSGKSAGTIPVVSSESYFQLNYSEAERLGLNLSEGLVASADEVIR